MFLLHSPRGRPHWTLSSIPLCGVRTFLGSCDPRLPVFLKSILIKSITSPENSLASFRVIQGYLILLFLPPSGARAEKNERGHPAPRKGHSPLTPSSSEK